MGTDGGGLNRLSPGASRTDVYRHDPSDPTSIGSDAILALLEDRAGRIWVGGWDAGLGLLDPRTGRVTSYRLPEGHNNIYRVVEDGPRDLLLATFGGVGRFDRQTRTFSPVTVRRGSIPGITTGLARDAAGNLWLASNDGLYRIDQGMDSVVQFRYDAKDPLSFGPGAARALFLDSRGNFWIGFDGGGLRCLPAGGGAARAWRVADGLAGNSVHDILEDETGQHLGEHRTRASRGSQARSQLPE